MVSVVKLKELGFKTEGLPEEHRKVDSHIVHHVLRGYKKFNEDFVHLFSDSVSAILGIEDAKAFKKELIEKAKAGEKDDILHCALNIMSIHYTKYHHVNHGQGISYTHAHNRLQDFMKKSSARIIEIKNRFPAVTDDIIESVFANKMLNYKKSA